MTKLAELSELELVAKFKNNELNQHEFFSILIERYYPALMEFGRLHYPQALNEAEIEDLVQSTFIDVLTLVRRYDLKINFLTWLLNIFTSKSNHELVKKKSKESTYLGEFESSDKRVNNIAVEESKVEDSIHNEELSRTLREVLSKKLSTEENKLILLHYVEDMSVSEIAKALNESSAKIRYDLKRIQQKIYYHLKMTKKRGNKTP